MMKPTTRKLQASVLEWGKFRAGMILDKQPSGKDRFPIALIGKVYCKVDARFAPIEVG